jgi:hypothetical protein
MPSSTSSLVTATKLKIYIWVSSSHHVAILHSTKEITSKTLQRPALSGASGAFRSEICISAMLVVLLIINLKSTKAKYLQTVFCSYQKNPSNGLKV